MQELIFLCAIDCRQLLHAIAGHQAAMSPPIKTHQCITSLTLTFSIVLAQNFRYQEQSSLFPAF